MSETMDRKEAQRRVERIRAFRQQLEELLEQGVLTLTREQRERLDLHLAGSLAELSERFDVDVSESQKQISLGMLILSTLGGLAFCAALILFFYRFWGIMTTTAQVAVLAGAPALGLVGLDTVARREKTRYFTGLIALVVLASFALNLAMLGNLFNVLPTPNAYLAWGLFALIIAYAYRLSIPLFAGLIALLVFAATGVTVLSGIYIGDFLQRPELFIPAGLLIAAVPLAVPHRKALEFPAVYHTVGICCFFLALEIQVHAGTSSYLPFAAGKIETVYRILGFAAAGLAIWFGIRRGLAALVNLGSLFFAIFVFDRLFTSWWDWMPKYLFFLIIGLTALIMLAVFRRLRIRTRRVSA